MRTIVQISDIHLGESIEKYKEINPEANLLSILEDIKRRGITEIVITGDICSKDSASYLHRLLESYGFKYSFVLGNHDDEVLFKDIFKMEHRYYSYSYEERTYIFMDSSKGVIDESQLDWFKDVLERLQGDEAVIFVHHPILDCDNSVMDMKYPLSNRYKIELLINSIKQQVIVFCGHYHMSYYIEKGNIRQYVAPSTFYQLKQYGDKLEKEDLPIGYRVIRLGKDVETEVVRVGDL